MPRSHNLLFTLCAFQSLKGRIMAVDWAVSKHTFQTGQPDAQQGVLLGTVANRTACSPCCDANCMCRCACVSLTDALRGRTCRRRASHTSYKF